MVLRCCGSLCSCGHYVAKAIRVLRTVFIKHLFRPYLLSLQLCPPYIFHLPATLPHC
ncbi:hypothetical protein BDZ85DRAFT_270811 [Elsinoe ampelina]|uniref:Uncharacterized protein n=1 Tax=Elsinoe ampelina TaxID=302913 RepID=A0A6A6FXZ7_9PEZI|nr:hypothetical protein BDZ85DRAFT_270811 [Elsinoe ampelina]